MIPSKITDLFTVVSLLPQPSSECEIKCEADLVLVQTYYVFFLYIESIFEKYWLAYMCIRKQEGLCQNKVNSNIVSIYNCNMGCFRKVSLEQSRHRISSTDSKFSQNYSQINSTISKVLLKTFHLNGNTMRFHPQIEKLELHTK